MKNSFFLFCFFIFCFPIIIIADVEPNNDCTQAELINVNTSTTGTLRRDSPNRDRYDYYYFIAPSDGTVTITTSGFTGDMDGYLYNSTCSSYLTYDNSWNSNINISYNVSAGTTYKIALYADSGNSTYTLNVAFGPTFSGNNYKDFSILYTENLRGDIRQIGNTILGRSSQGKTICPKDTTNNADKNLITRYWDVDGDSSTFNSSSSDLQIPTGATIKKAYLYWQGRTTSSNSANAAQIKLKAPGKSYVTLNAPSANMHWDGSRGSYFPYQGSVEITNYMNGSGTYTVGDITTYAGGYLDGLGAYGAWSIVVVYAKDDETLRNITIYDGYKTIATNNSEDFTLSGFLTPSKGSVNSKFLIFTGEGDVNLKGDYVTMNGTRLTRFNDNSTNTGDYNTFNASITKDNAYVTTRQPSCQNNLGIDIHTYDVGSTGLNIVKNNHKSASLTIGTNSDVYYLSVFAFATQLYEPRVCYYINRISDDSNTTIFENKQFVNSIEANKNYTFDLWISNMKKSASDTDIETAKLLQVYLNMTNLDYKESSTKIQNLGTSSKSFISDTTNNDIGEYDNNKSTWRLGIGANSTQGGSIEPATSFDDNSKKAFIELQGKFLIENNTSSLNLLDHLSFKASFQTDSITIGSDNAQFIEQCVDLNTTATIYQPPLGVFNVTNQSADLSSGDPQDGLDIKNALWSQVSGKPFTVKIVALDNDKTTLKNFTGNVILDLVDSTNITDEQSTCTNAPLLQQYKNPNPKTNLFSNQSTKDFTLQYDKAHANSRFRVKFYDFSTIETIEGQPCSVSNTSANINGVPQCFNDMNKIKKYFPLCSDDYTNVCVSNQQGGDDDWKCYECITGYNQPVCSRDNFAIRPATYSLGIDATRLIGKKEYTLEINATLFNSDSNVSGYNQVIDNSSDKNSTDEFILPATCVTLTTDKKPLSNGATFTEGRSQSTLYASRNVGDVLITYNDNLWTQIDRSAYNTKAFSDCIESSSTNTANGDGKIGCLLSGSKQFYFFPKAFDNTLLLQNFNNGNFTYLSNDGNMSAELLFSPRAILEDNTTATNYTAGCFARDITYTVELNGSIQDKRNRIRYFGDGVTSNLENNNTIATATFSSTEDNFISGTANNLQMLFNFTRNINSTDEPFRIKRNDFNITSVIDQNNTSGDDFNRTNDHNATFYYGRVYSTDYKGESPITTTIRYELYCKDCNRTDFNITGVQSPTSINWYQNELHDNNTTTNYGNVTQFSSIGTTKINNADTAISGIIITDGIENNTLSNATAPYTDRIQMRPSSWLLHNLYNPNATTNDFNVEFIKSGTWAGSGSVDRDSTSHNTGAFTNDTNITRSNRKMNW